MGFLSLLSRAAFKEVKPTVSKALESTLPESEAILPGLTRKASVSTEGLPTFNFTGPQAESEATNMASFLSGAQKKMKSDARKKLALGTLGTAAVGNELFNPDEAEAYPSRTYVKILGQLLKEGRKTGDVILRDEILDKYIPHRITKADFASNDLSPVVTKPLMKLGVLKKIDKKSYIFTHPDELNLRAISQKERDLIAKRPGRFPGVEARVRKNEPLSSQALRFYNTFKQGDEKALKAIDPLLERIPDEAEYILRQLEESQDPGNLRYVNSSRAFLDRLFGLSPLMRDIQQSSFYRHNQSMEKLYGRVREVIPDIDARLGRTATRLRELAEKKRTMSSEEFSQLPSATSPKEDAYYRILRFIGDRPSIPYKDLQKNFPGLVAQHATDFGQTFKGGVVTKEAVIDRLNKSFEHKYRYDVESNNPTTRTPGQFYLQVRMHPSEIPANLRPSFMLHQNMGIRGSNTVGWIDVSPHPEENAWVVREIQSDPIAIAKKSLKTIVEEHKKSDAALKGLTSVGDTTQIEKNAQRLAEADPRTHALRKFIDEHKNWGEFALSSLLKRAREYGVEKVYVYTPEGVLKEQSAASPGKLNQYYNDLPRKLGFVEVQPPKAFIGGFVEGGFPGAIAERPSRMRLPVWAFALGAGGALATSQPDTAEASSRISIRAALKEIVPKADWTKVNKVLTQIPDAAFSNVRDVARTNDIIQKYARNLYTLTKPKQEVIKDYGIQEGKRTLKDFTEQHKRDVISRSNPKTNRGTTFHLATKAGDSFSGEHVIGINTNYDFARYAQSIAKTVSHEVGHTNELGKTITYTGPRSLTWLPSAKAEFDRLSPEFIARLEDLTGTRLNTPRELFAEAFARKVLGEIHIFEAFPTFFKETVSKTLYQLEKFSRTPLPLPMIFLLGGLVGAELFPEKAEAAPKWLPPDIVRAAMKSAKGIVSSAEARLKDKMIGGKIVNKVLKDERNPNLREVFFEDGSSLQLNAKELNDLSRAVGERDYLRKFALKGKREQKAQAYESLYRRGLKSDHPDREIYMKEHESFLARIHHIDPSLVPDTVYVRHPKNDPNARLYQIPKVYADILAKDNEVTIVGKPKMERE